MASNVNFCVNCFCDNVSGRCPVCGYDNNAHITVPHHLKPGTILNGKYILGRMIGEGGFGITYAAKDAESNTKVAIKEYFPNGFATRNTASQNSVTVFPELTAMSSQAAAPNSCARRRRLPNSTQCRVLCR